MKNIRVEIKRRLEEAAYVKLLFLQRCVEPLQEICQKVIQALKKGKKIYIFGNGGSAADAQHIACELQGKFYKVRKPLPVIALTTNTSIITAIGNDIGFEHTFSRQVEAVVRRGDIVIAISTSGNSLNVLKAVQMANKLGALTIGFTGQDGGKLKNSVSLCLKAPSKDVARIQECHITAGHILCDIIESILFCKN